MTQALLIGTVTAKKAPVTLSLSGMLHHTLIVGQSGSGKSFFVARLLEEILLRTGARVVALDPNGDLRNLDETDGSGAVDRQGEMNSAAGAAGLEPLDNVDDFGKRWATQRMVFLNSAERFPKTPSPKRVERRRLVVDWATMDDDQDALLGLDSHLRPTQLLGVNACRLLVEYAQSGKGMPYLADSLRGLAGAAEMFAEQNVNMVHYPYAKHLLPSDWSSVRARFLDLISRHRIWANDPSSAAGRSGRESLTGFIDAAFDSDGSLPDWNALVIGLDAARQPDALLAASVALGRLWRNAKAQARRLESEDQRFPTFIVIDEAHNFVPAHSDDGLRRRVSEKILQIASEGRKYGLYLILATQRPTKLHPELVPECENSCVLRVQSDRELKFAAETLGIPNDRVSGAARFMQGQGLLTGRWVDGNVVDVMAAPARSQVGGGGLTAVWTGGPRIVEVEYAAEVTLDLASVAVRVQDLLRSSAVALDMAKLADSLLKDPDLNCRPENNWMGFGRFSDLLTGLGIDNLEIAGKPGLVYIAGLHSAPEVDPDSEDGSAVWSGVPIGLSKMRSAVSVPLLSQLQFKSIFEALADELAVNPYRMADTAKAVRDSLRESGANVGRAPINFILRGISLSGHDFSSDKPQDPATLASAFADSLLQTTAAGVSLSAGETREVSEWITDWKGLVPVGESLAALARATKSPNYVEDVG